LLFADGSIKQLNHNEFAVARKPANVKDKENKGKKTHSLALTGAH
jgi:hypothetical protein